MKKPKPPRSALNVGAPHFREESTTIVHPVPPYDGTPDRAEFEIEPEKPKQKRRKSS